MTSTPTGARQNHDLSRTALPRIPAQPLPGEQRRQPKEPLPRYDYEHYSRLAGPLTGPGTGLPYRVQYRSLLSQEPHRIRAALLLGAAPLVSIGLFGWLMQPDHWTRRDPNLRNGTLLVLDIVMLVSIGLIELFRTLNVLSNAHATLVARDPVPVVPETGTRVAFLTSFVPGKEPLEMVTRTLEAAVRVRHRGLLHVWLLDEGDDPAVKEVCARLGVHHFSRRGIARWNRCRGPHRPEERVGGTPAGVARVHVDADAGCRPSRSTAPFSRSYRSSWNSCGVHPSTMCSSASGSRITVACRSPMPRATPSSQVRYALPSAAPPLENCPQSRCGML